MNGIIINTQAYVAFVTVMYGSQPFRAFHRRQGRFFVCASYIDFKVLV